VLAERTKERTRVFLRILGWALAGMLLTILPLAAYYSTHFAELESRAGQVSMFQSGWLTHEIQITHKSAVWIVLNQFQRAVLIPFHTPPSRIFYGDEVPFIGVPMAVLLALGLLLTLLQVWKRQYLALLLTYWAIVAAVGISEDPSQTQRVFGTAPLMAIFAAIALVAIARVIRELVGVPKLATAGLAAAVVLLGAWNLNYYFFSPTHDDRMYGRDPNTLVATQLAYSLHALAKPETVYFFAAPRMFYNGFQDLPFIAPNAKGIDVNDPWTAATKPPQLNGPTVFALLPHRIAELPFVRAAYPGGNLQQVKDTNGAVLFTLYEVG
jgi:hypothetical protein